jgi:hypothetical protein
VKARFASTIACGHWVNVGDIIIRVAPHQYACARCAISTAQERGRFAERLLEDPKVRALLCKALVTDSESEAGTALAAARKLHKKAVAA